MYEDLFYKRLSELRNQIPVSAREMSLAIGQNENYINLIENGRTFPSMSGFFYICEYLKIHPKDFFNDNIKNLPVNKWNIFFLFYQILQNQTVLPSKNNTIKNNQNH